MNRIELNLQAGRKYLTVRVDNGEAGPVITPRDNCWMGSNSQVQKFVPFECDYYWIGRDGWCVPCDASRGLPELQITGEYREPTIAERLEKWRAKDRAERTQGEFAEIVEAVRKLEGGSK